VHSVYSEIHVPVALYRNLWFYLDLQEYIQLLTRHDLQLVLTAMRD